LAGGSKPVTIKAFRSLSAARSQIQPVSYKFGSPPPSNCFTNDIDSGFFDQCLFRSLGVVSCKLKVN
jgi:hypothetical protein